jgi:hypothetical protein
MFLNKYHLCLKLLRNTNERLRLHYLSEPWHWSLLFAIAFRVFDFKFPVLIYTRVILGGTRIKLTHIL